MPSTSDSIHVNLYDYTATNNSQWENVNYQCTGKGCTKRPFTFTTHDNCGRNGNYQWNAYKGQGKGIYRNIVASNLGKDGYPVLNTDRNVNKSLSYLFDDDTPGVEEKGTDVNGLFRQDSDGYYYFDSRNTFAKFDEADNKFDLYEPGRFYEIGEDDHVPAGAGAFMPFNSLKGGDDNTAWYEYDGKEGQNGYKFNESDNYLFGMDLSASFFMPKDGQVNGQDMIFEFEGDDDVWVFIDNVLVLDIGGIHDSYSGSINFSNGKVFVDSGDDTTLAKMFEEAGKTWNDSDYAQHTIRFFYFERGEGSSNCKLTNTDNFSRAEFTMRVEVSDTENGTYKPYVGFYDLYESDKQLDTGLRTNDDGTFTLRNGQFARLTGGENGFSATSYYKVYELTADNYDKEDYEFNLSETDMVDKSGASQTDLIGQSKPIMVGNVNHITVRNKFNDKDKYTFTVSKRLASGKASGQQFELKVTNGEGTPYTGEYYLSTDGGLGNEPMQATADGVIKLEAGQDAVIMNVAPGTTFKVEEVNLPSGYLDPTYSCTTSAAQPCDSVDSVTVDNANRKPSVTVTNTLATAYAGVDIVKTLVGRPWSDSDEFVFQVTADDSSYPLPDNVDEDGLVAVTKENEEYWDDEATRVVGLYFDALPYLGPDTTYGYTVTEVAGSADGIVYSKARWRLIITVRCGEDGTVKSEVVVQQELDDDGNPATISTNAIIRPMTFTNRFISVSSLPLTGGRSTARTLLLAGGGVLLVAGAAWLLARRRRV